VKGVAVGVLFLALAFACTGPANPCENDYCAGKATPSCGASDALEAMCSTPGATCDVCGNDGGLRLSCAPSSGGGSKWQLTDCSF
jgi:hypothetical protein